MAAERASAQLSRASTRVVRRFAVPDRHLAFWIVMWVAVVAAEFGDLAPFIFGPEVPIEPVQIVFRLVGGSFAACGLIAWHRRPDSYSGRLMTATGFAFFASPLLAQLDSPLALTAAYLLPDLWVLFFVPLLLTFLTGGRLRTRMDKVLTAIVALEIVVLAPLFLVFTELDGNLLLVTPNAELSTAIDRLQRGVFLAVSVVTSGVIAVRWHRASGPGRRAMLPSVAGAVCLLLFAALLVVDLVADDRSQVLLWTAACSLVAVPSAFLAGLLRSRLARGGLADLFGRLPTMPPEQLQSALGRVLGDPDLIIAFPLPDGRAFVDADGRAVPLPDSGDASQQADKSVATVRNDGVPVA